MFQSRPPRDRSDSCVMIQKLMCDHCGGVIGVYEPVVVIVDGEARTTSRAAEEAVVARPGPRYHVDCYLERIADVEAGRVTARIVFEP